MAEPKQERAVKTRETILYAAAEIFDAYGYSGASISKIMERADVTQGGMYFHFKSKLGLAKAVLAAQQESVVIPEGPPGLQRLIDLNFFLASELQNNVLFRASVRLAVEQGDFGMRDDTAYQEWVDQFHALLCAARERGELLPDVDELEFANVLVGCYSGTQVFSNIASGRADLQSRLTSMWRYLLPAIATPKALMELRLPVDAQRLAA
ncbi:TetR family transcriptional regulator [Streptomyces solincola]|uniref:TetR family transcriptional regulator n=1 Tax=Streptomyces solincola TaxID=2100817 RepID=A0A2S9Q1F1_9ACTN|nr:MULTISPECIES: ScbR family autoregulator-binding transcription factor [Streptomyces]PRH80505.1 TetR family transcriptional regulator [Streptomyces solincola]